MANPSFLPRFHALVGTLFRLTLASSPESATSQDSKTEFQPATMDWLCVSAGTRVLTHSHWQMQQIACTDLLPAVLRVGQENRARFRFHLAHYLPHVLRILVNPAHASLATSTIQFVITCVTTVTDPAFQVSFLQLVLPLLLSRLPHDKTVITHVMALGGRFPDVFKAQMGTLDPELKVFLQQAAATQQQEAALAKQKQMEAQLAAGPGGGKKKKKKKKGRRDEMRLF